MFGNFSIYNFSVSVGRPWWLILIPLILPPLVLMSMRSLAGLGWIRRAVAILLRATVVTLIVLALAELQMVRRNDRLATLFLLDLSQSVPRDRQAPMLQYVNSAINSQKRKDDLAGVIAFGKAPKVELPPTPYPSDLMGIESTIDGEFTDLGSAIKLALATFPEDTARRIVILSDGNENRGNALEQALSANGLNVQIDVLPIEYSYDREVLVDKISLPPDVKKGETVNINVVVKASEPSSGTLQIYQKSDNYRSPAAGNEQPIPVELKRGPNVFTLKQTITEPNFYTFTAEFVPDKDSGDRRAINNVAEGFTHARGVGHVLLIEGTAGEHVELVKALREKKLEVTVLSAGQVTGSGTVGGDSLPSDLAQLQAYDTVILGNVPKDSLTESQQKMLEANVHDMGSGLIMLGGPSSFGAGGWMNTPVEKALPVDMQIKAMRVQGKSAMAMIMHASEIAQGNYWQKVVAEEALKTLSYYDYAGLIHWQGQEAWLFPVKAIGDNKQSMLSSIDRMTPGDMPDFDPSLQMAMRGLMAKTDAMTRHIVVISDGDPTPPTPAVVNQLIARKITVTAVLTAAHGNDTQAISVMKNLADKTKGRFYNVTNSKALPRIYQKEARLISRPLIFERQPGWSPTLSYASEPVTGLPAEMPPITGLVLTSLKESELVEAPLMSPLPTGQPYPLLAHWTYGLGRTLAFTSDAGRKWTTAWPTWDSYAAFWSQVVRWSMRPVDAGNLTLSVRRDEGRIKVVVDALDKENQFLNFLQIQGNAVDPDMNRTTVELAQTAPGRYEGTIENAEQRGNYFVTLGYHGADGVQGVISTGVSVPYSDEYRELQSNRVTLETIATLTNGLIIPWKDRPNGTIDLARTLEGGDVFRRDAFLKPPRSFQDLWPRLLWLAAVLFLFDVAVRRVSPDFGRMRKVISEHWQKLRGKDVAPQSDYMEKLRSRKAEVSDQLDRSRAATQFEAPPISMPTEPIGEPLLEDITGTAAPRPKPSPETRPGLAPGAPAPEAESYTNRLLKAKKKVWEEREKEQGS
jgi:uncharacterized membrane protein/Mg-chelatase subunit ChlD